MSRLFNTCVGESNQPAFGRASTRVLVAAGIGVLAAVLTGIAGRWGYSASVGWDVAALTFLIWTWLVIAGMDAAATASHATREDPSKRISEVLVLGAAVASLAGVADLLVRASSASGLEQGIVAGIGVLSVAVSWFVVHTLFTLRYALLYYVGGAGMPTATGHLDRTSHAGVDFNQDQAPRYTDFAYLAFTIGMTFQVSDTAVASHGIRMTALRHGLLSYLFGSVILASSVNLIASLASSSH
jgi:uncharacterized membrane protein